MFSIFRLLFFKFSTNKLEPFPHASNCQINYLGSQELTAKLSSSAAYSDSNPAFRIKLPIISIYHPSSFAVDLTSDLVTYNPYIYS